MIFESLFLFIELIIAYLLQTSVFTNFQMAGVVPDILMIIVCTAAYTRGKKAGLVLGFISGLLIDLTFGNVIGLFAFMYLTIGYLCGFANKIYLYDDYTIPFVLIGVSEFVYNIFYYLFFMFLQGKLNIGWYIIKYMFPKVIYTVFISILIYRLLNMQHMFWCKRPERIRKAKRKIDEGT